MDQSYEYCEAWKRSVNRCSSHWQMYCLAKSLTRRFIKARIEGGQAGAKHFIEVERRVFAKACRVVGRALRALACGIPPWRTDDLRRSGANITAGREDRYAKRAVGGALCDRGG